MLHTQPENWVQVETEQQPRSRKINATKWVTRTTGTPSASDQLRGGFG